MEPVIKVSIKMYRPGTGDCFLLQFKTKNRTVCNMLIDCGCIQGGKKDFEPILKDISQATRNKIDILVVTHQHDDHINGFKHAKALFSNITIKKVWFAWTEDETDDLANDLRKNHSKLRMALQMASTQLNGLVSDNYFDNVFAADARGDDLVKGKKKFAAAIADLDSLNILGVKKSTGKIPSMVEIFTGLGIIKADTVVEFHSPGDILKNVAGLPGMRIFVLGPPRDAAQMDITEEEGENFEKRESPASKDFAFAAAVTGRGNTVDIFPFDPEYENSVPLPFYTNGPEWRKIDNDWLFSAGGLALRYEGSINNTSLALAFQFENSERVLLFPGDAEFGNWNSWHNPDFDWRIRADGKMKKVNAEYLLENTVFYKIGHHCSQNGSASKKGVVIMKGDDLTVMAPLNYKKIHDGWLNTMPNDLLCEMLIEKSKGKFYLSGDVDQILPNMKTDRVIVRKSYEEIMRRLNKKFDKKIFIQCEITG